MNAEAVVDASVLGAALFKEEHSAEAIDFLLRADTLAAPTLLTAEIASLAVKKVWRGEADLDLAKEAMLAVDEFVPTRTPCELLAVAALDIAAAHKLSAYDSFYVALALERDVPLATLDIRLVRRVRELGLRVAVDRPGGL